MQSTNNSAAYDLKKQSSKSPPQALRKLRGEKLAAMEELRGMGCGRSVRREVGCLFLAAGRS
jgi:hypothetical protein